MTLHYVSWSPRSGEATYTNSFRTAEERARFIEGICAKSVHTWDNVYPEPRADVAARCQSWTVDECISALEHFDDDDARWIVNAWYKGHDLSGVLPDLRRWCIERLSA